MSYTGVLHLSAKKRQQKTVLDDCYYEGAMKITRPVYLEENEPTLYCIHVGGGYVDGDRYKTSIHLSEAAAVSVTTQSSTKIYRTPTDCVKQETIINLARSSVLEYFPDPIIAYEDAKFIRLYIWKRELVILLAILSRMDGQRMAVSLNMHGFVPSKKYIEIIN